MTTDINGRLRALRDVMRREHLGAFIFPSEDPHQSEYTAGHWKGREWISGFGGSAGTAVVTLGGAALWTDSRYFLAAEEQLRGTEYELMRLKVDGTPTIAAWLAASHGMDGLTEVGIDGTCCSESFVRQLTAELRAAGGLTLRTNMDPLRLIWHDRPPLPRSQVTVHPLPLAGEATREKLARIRRALRTHHADGMLMAALDDIAWTLNLRGADVHCNPVFVSYLLLTTTTATLYVDRSRLAPGVEQYLRGEGVGVDDYGRVATGLRDYFEYNILLDPDEVNHTLYKAVGREVVEAESPVRQMKAVKNAAERAGFRQAMVRDGIAMVRFLRWLDAARPQGGALADADGTPLTEISVSDKLQALRAAQPLFRGLSFDTIAGYGPHGAIVHYEATAATDATLRPEGLLLLDSGAQYEDGTTDITRTIALGPVSDDMRRVYTLVLKGHLRLQNLVFPDGASGTQLDAVARMDLWRAGLNYLHGTGHGVGSYLNVHEGPHQIRMEYRPAPMRDGMTVTDEPGIYVAGQFGVRIENTLLATDAMTTDFGRFLRFEPLTLCPIDTRPLERTLMTAEEVQWLNDYHQMVFDRLSPHLDADERAWLADATKPL